MKANRFGKWAEARAKVAMIQEHLQSGGLVIIANHLKATEYNKPVHAKLFEARKNGAFVRHGKQMLCFDGNAVKFGRYV